MFAQGTRTPLERSHDELLAEVRALRAEVRQMTSAGIRTQLLVGRLQLQEQRVVSAARQLAETQSALKSTEEQLAGEKARVRQLEEAGARAAGQGRASFQQAITDAGTQIEEMQRQEFQLQTREKDLQRTLNDEQVRWTNFNDRLDALERSLPAGG